MSNGMEGELDHNIFDLPELRNQIHVFQDREHAGLTLSKMLKVYKDSNVVVFGIPAGGVPVAAPIARQLKLVLDVAVVNKVTLPRNTEAGYGAVSFEGTVRLNQDMLSGMGLTSEDINDGVQKASRKVKRRLKKFRKGLSFPDVKDSSVILVDDGVASGFTMLVAVEALKNKGAEKIIIAVPTAHLQALKRVSSQVEQIYCANLRGGWGFAVADAYQNWYDVDEQEVTEILDKLR